jgi:polysaccharide export outer membrane protein
VLLFLSSCVTNKNLDILSVKNNSNVEVFNNQSRFRVGDLLSIEIKSLTPSKYDFFNKAGQDVYSRLSYNPYLYGYLINDSGYVSLPSLGKIFLEGKTLFEAEQIVKQVASSYFNNPHVKIVNINSHVSVLGEVISPGRFNVVDPNTNIIEVIAQANGFTPIANRKKIKIIRLEVDEPVIYYLDLTDKDIMNSELFFVKSGDIIRVEPMKKRFFVVNNLSSAISILISGLTLYFLINQSN